MKRRISTDDVERVLRERDPDKHPVVTSNYVADQTDVSRPTALSRLKDARDEGRVKQSEISQASVWWLSDDPITKERAAEQLTEVEGEADDREPEPVTDGALDNRSLEGVDTLLKSSREMMHETRALRQQRNQLDRVLRKAMLGAVVAAVGIVLAFINAFVTLPQLVTALAGAAFLFGLSYIVYVLGTAEHIREPDMETIREEID